MVFPRRLARFNRIVTNRILGVFTPRLPYFGTIVHIGRRSGKTYHTPVTLYHLPESYVVALTYGPGADWVKNVLASGGCEVVTRGRTVKLSRPKVVHDENRTITPLPVRGFLGLIGVTDFLYLEPA